MSAIKLNLTPAQEAEVLGYFSNPKIKTFIEIQDCPSRSDEFRRFYERHQGKPLSISTTGYSEIKSSSDKWSNQYRVYFNLIDPKPPYLDPEMFKNTHSGPYNKKRISRKALVELMLKNGFDIGDNSGKSVFNSVRSKINPSYTSHFDDGYKLAS